MTNSSKRRMNNAARYAALNAWPDGGRGTFSATAAEHHIRSNSTGDIERFDDVNWPYAAELLNRMAKPKVRPVNHEALVELHRRIERIQAGMCA